MVPANFHDRECGERGKDVPWRRLGNVVAVVNAGGYGFLKSVGGAGDGFVPIFPERSELWEVRGGHQYTSIIVLEHDRIGKHHCNPTFVGKSQFVELAHASTVVSDCRALFIYWYLSHVLGDPTIELLKGAKIGASVAAPKGCLRSVEHGCVGTKSVLIVHG